jgi:hypothetical protein
MTAATTQQQDRERRERFLRQAVRQRVARASEALASDMKAPAESLAKAPKLDKTQVRKLENLAYSTDKVSDITDWLKRQIGRSDHRERWRYEHAGVTVLDGLSALRRQAENIVKELCSNEKYSAIINDDLPRQVHLELCREYVRHLAAEFLYRSV